MLAHLHHEIIVHARTGVIVAAENNTNATPLTKNSEIRIFDSFDSLLNYRTSRIAALDLSSTTSIQERGSKWALAHTAIEGTPGPVQK
jgi:hypothetical protein